MMRIMIDRPSEELRYKVRRRLGFGKEQRLEILGPRGWTVEGEANDARGHLLLAARQLAEIFRRERKDARAARN